MTFSKNFGNFLYIFPKAKKTKKQAFFTFGQIFCRFITLLQ